MRETKPKWRAVRIAAVALGLLVALAGFGAYAIGLSASRGFSAGKTALVALGIAVVAIGLLGRRLLAFYRTTAIVLLNTIVLASVLELGLALVARLSDFLPAASREEASQDLFYVNEGRERLPYFKEQSWGKQYWREYHAAWNSRTQAYRPYIVWRARPFAGETLNIDAEGRRVTPGAECGPGATTVFTFGGSTMWGTGVPDWGTIPALLQAGLAARGQRPVCVVNYSEQGFVSTQDVIQLLLLLEARRVPDMAIFYDGINDVFAAYASGAAGSHHELASIAARLENRPEVSPWVDLASRTRIYRTFLRLVSGHQRAAPYRRRGIATEALAADVGRVYLGNLEVVEALARAYGFTAHFFWQTNLLTTGKTLTEEESAIKSVAAAVYPDVEDLYRSTDRQIREALSRYPVLHNLDDVFDDQKELTFIDPFHVTITGNERVAARMLETIAR